MSLHAIRNAPRSSSAKGDQAFSARAKSLPRFVLRDGARVLKAGSSVDSVTRIPAAQVPHGAEIVNERESVKARWCDSAGGFVIVTKE
jgi:hypothetical protein